MFSFQKRKQPVPRKVMQGLPFIKEIEMLKETVQRKITKTSNLIQSHHFYLSVISLGAIEDSGIALTSWGYMPVSLKPAMMFLTDMAIFQDRQNTFQNSILFNGHPE